MQSIDDVILNHAMLKWHKVAYALMLLGHPAHFAEVASTLRKAFPEEALIADRSVHAMLGNQEPKVFRQVGAGTYGLTGWGLPVAKDSVDLIVQVLEEELRWMSFQEITMRVRRRGWQYKTSSVRVALGLENERPRRRIRIIESGNSTRYGLSGWHRDEN